MHVSSLVRQIVLVMAMVYGHCRSRVSVAHYCLLVLLSMYALIQCTLLNLGGVRVGCEESRSALVSFMQGTRDVAPHYETMQ